MNSATSAFAEMSDAALLEHVDRLRREELATTVSLIAALAEVERRLLYLSQGYSSLYVYCRNHLGLSEFEAYLRMQVARAAVAYPIIIEMLADERLNLSGVAILAKHLNTDNYLEVLEAAAHKTKHEVMALVATLHPQPEVASAIWQCRTISPTDAVSSGDVAPSPVENSPSAVTTEVAAARTAFERSGFTQLSPDRFRVVVTISRESFEVFRRLQEISRHVVPNGDPALIFERALRCSLRDMERRRTAQTERPHRFVPCDSGSRYVPAHVRRVVWARDGGQCAFVGPTGRCMERAFLELHHVVPYAEGGPTTADNLQLRCRAHNAFEARLLSDTG
jgi:5-methylcytosine-specific restriction endonuclease McrA